MQQRISHPRIHRPPAEGLFNWESLDEHPKLQVGRLHGATHRLYAIATHNSMNRPQRNLKR